MSSVDDQKPVTVGPWGGQGGSSWDDGVYSTIRQLVIAHGFCIDSIQIEYDNKGNPLWSKKHGGNGGSKTDKVKLDFPNEFLTSVHGYYGSLKERGPILVRSLTFHSNRKTYGPFGIEQGTSFSMNKGKIIGFHGRSGWYLDAIGVHSKTIPNQNPAKRKCRRKLWHCSSCETEGGICDSPAKGTQKVSFRSTPQKVPPKLPEGVLTYRPWGGQGGAKFDDGTYTGIRQIILSRNVGIVSMKVCYDREGQAVWGSKHGGTGGFRPERVSLVASVSDITGTFGPLMYMGPNVIKSLTFYTNKGKHQPYGDEQGPYFTNKMNEGKIVGFIGREGLFLDAIGVHVMKGKAPPPKPSISLAIIESEKTIAEIDNSPWSNKLVLARRGPAEEVACGVVKEPSPCGPGPWGGDGGRAWDDGVKLDYPNEVLICISGYYGPINNDEKSKVIRSLTFYTSRGKYGPFGEEIGTYFTSTTTQGKVVGFHGRCSSYLDARSSYAALAGKSKGLKDVSLQNVHLNSPLSFGLSYS
ncbi:Jacalin-related lectin 3 [Hibiscus syriacus]|uniref:Jacalin-related lectin 3 n=1 Tax=Hibiscus syriacus TaxID=106335 RepID=A0A6A2XCQ3_HIBSY|nr:Jacalin-related lectin 3 [Hibiscus syriacus]